MTLNEYLERTGESDEAFGARCTPPLTRIEVWRLRHRRHNARANKVAAIEAATGHQVTAKDLVPEGLQTG